MVDSQPLMSEHDLEARTGLSRRFLYQALLDGKIGSYKMGRARRISEDQYQAWLASTVQNATPGNESGSDRGPKPELSLRSGDTSDVIANR